MTDLSGRVDAIEDQLAYFTQDLLQKIDLVSSSTQSQVWNTSFNSLSNLVTQIQANVRTLQSLYANLNYVVSNHYSYFTGHTGMVAESGHNGLS